MGSIAKYDIRDSYDSYASSRLGNHRKCVGTGADFMQENAHAKREYLKKEQMRLREE